VVNILKENGIDPKTDPTQGTWADFLKAHRQSLWQCDFFSKHIVTPEGIRQCFVLVFLHVGSRRAYLSPCTFGPNPRWVASQATAFLADAKDKGLEVGIVLRDRDANYAVGSPDGFDTVLEQAGVEVKMLSFRSPNTNAYCERFIQAVQQECLDQFVAFGTEHLDLLCREYGDYYNKERPHQGIGNLPPVVVAPTKEMADVGQVKCQMRLGGVLKHYYREVA
jgi:putative transposase